MKKCNPYFYVPNIRDLENTKTHKSSNNFQNNCCEDTSNQNTYNRHHNRNCNNYPVDNDFLDRCCGEYTISFPLLIFDLDHNSGPGYSKQITKGDISFTLNNGDIFRYHIIYNNNVTDKLNSLSCVTNNRVRKVGSEQYNVTIRVEGSIFYEQETNSHNTTFVNPVLKTIVFNTEVSLLPFEPLDPNHPLIYQIIIPSIDNRGCAFINYTYTNKLFNINVISVNTEIDIQIPDFS